jgi:hypothetical protein
LARAEQNDWVNYTPDFCILESLIEIQSVDILPIAALGKRFRFERQIKTLSQMMMTAYRLLIAIEHSQLNWPFVDSREKN